jgi:hypothetical protein
MLAGSLFLIVINLRAVNEQIGVADGIGFIQEIHIASMLVILTVTLLSVWAQKRIEQGVAIQAITRTNLSVATVVGILFLLINVVLLFNAIR